MNPLLPDSSGAAPQAGTDDRAAPRFTLLIRPAKLHLGQMQYMCIIRDISATGVRIRLFHDLAWQGAAALELQTGERYPFELVWNKGNEAGLQFHDPIEVDNVVGDCSLYPKRDLRFDTSLPVSFRTGGIAHTGKIANLSRQGALIEADATLAIDQAVMLDALGLPTIEARVRWKRQNRFGLVFDTTFSLKELAILLERLQNDRHRETGFPQAIAPRRSVS